MTYFIFKLAQRQQNISTFASIMWVEIGEIAVLVLFTSVKFLFAPTTIIALGYSFWETMVISLVGGWLGVVVFYFTGSAIFNWIAGFNSRQKVKRKFTKRNRFVIWLKNSFGLNGIAVILGFASIPLVCLLAAKYFREDGRTIYYLLGSVIVWSFTLTGLSILLKPVLIELI